MSLAVGVRALASNGTTEVLSLTVATGYELISLTMPERTWRRRVATAEDVEGDVEVQSVLEAGTWEIQLYVKGSSTSQVETRRASLLAAVEARVWYLEVTIDGVTTKWKANRADSVTSLEKPYLHNLMKIVTIHVPVQPRPV